MCYGGTFRFPYNYSPSGFSGKFYFSPNNGEGKRLVIENGKVCMSWCYNNEDYHVGIKKKTQNIKLIQLCCQIFQGIDPRFKVTSGILSLQHVTEKDNGYFSVPFGSFFLDRITLKVLGKIILHCSADW